LAPLPDGLERLLAQGDHHPRYTPADEWALLALEGVARRATFGSNPTRRWRTSSASATNRRFRRRKPSALSAEAIGAEFRCLDLGDYPLEVDRAALEQLVALIHEVEPDVILTHTAEDPFNPDHPVAHEAVKKARMLASGAGVQSGFKTIKPPVLYAFEPHQPELCGFMPNTFVDITPVFEQKKRAMEAIASQTYLQKYYAELAERRGNHARRVSGNSTIRYAEAFQRLL